MNSIDITNYPHPFIAKEGWPFIAANFLLILISFFIGITWLTWVFCIFLVSTSDAKYALTETKIGLTPAQIAPYILKKVGFNVGKKLMLLGEGFSGDEAFLIGMADYVVKDKNHLDSEVLQIMNKVKKCSPNGIAVTKNLLNSNYTIDTMHAAKLFSECIVHEEGREGFASFFEKRKPFWNKKD